MTLEDGRLAGVGNGGAGFSKSFDQSRQSRKDLIVLPDHIHRNDEFHFFFVLKILSKKEMLVSTSSIFAEQFL